MNNKMITSIFFLTYVTELEISNGEVAYKKLLT